MADPKEEKQKTWAQRLTGGAQRVTDTVARSKSRSQGRSPDSAKAAAATKADKSVLFEQTSYNSLDQIFLIGRCSSYLFLICS